MTPQRFFNFALILIAGAQAAYYYPLMPMNMASHFDAAGRANGWMPKNGFFIMYAFIMALMFALFTLMPRLLLKVPVSMINLPNKGYWLSPEHREQAGEMMQRYLNTAGNLTMALIVSVFQMSFRANLDKEGRMPEFAPFAIIVFVVLMAIWCVRFIRAFRIPPGPGGN